MMRGCEGRGQRTEDRRQKAEGKMGSTRIHPSAVIDREAVLAEDVVVGPNCVVAGGVEIGAGTILEANVYIEKNVKIGGGNHFFPFCTIGCRPQILSLGPEDETGGLEIGDNNIIREQVTIHPGMRPGGLTRIGNDNLLMIGVHIGHDCELGDKIVLSNYVQISGHCHIGTGVWLSGLVGVHQFITIGRWSYAAGLAGINRDVPPFLIVSGHYPPRIRAVNKRGLLRAGFDKVQQQRINEAYIRLYRSGGTLLENARTLAAEDGWDENVKEMVDVILKSSEHRFGRYLETLR
jgi:UDP-N-acetylglucosamine acyltransferase